MIFLFLSQQPEPKQNANSFKTATFKAAFLNRWVTTQKLSTELFGVTALWVISFF